MKIRKSKISAYGEIVWEGEVAEDGSPHGFWNYYDVRGLLYLKAEYLRGKLNGSYKSLYSNGDIVELGKMNNDKPIGLWYEDGY